MTSTTILGYPRIGPRRELKRAVEAYWAGRSDRTALASTAAELRQQVWTTLRSAGLSDLPSNTFSYYDHVLDTAVLVDAIPDRYRTIDDELDRYFAMARGTQGLPPLEMTKWFDTNYHYLVPEIGPDTSFEATPDKPVGEYAEAKALGIETRPVLLGPVSFLLLAKSTVPGFAPVELLDRLVDTYAALLDRLATAGVSWVQLDEPVFAADRSQAEIDALSSAYERLGRLNTRPKLVVTCSYGSMGPALPVLARTPVEGIGLDLVAGDDIGQIATAGLTNKVLYAGLVSGRNVWRTDLPGALSSAASVLGSVGELVVSTSCSLSHVPIDVELETDLDPSLVSRLAFARQKVDEVVLLGKALTDGRDAITNEHTARRDGSGTDARVRARLTALGDEHRRAPFESRAVAQRGDRLPSLPTTTIGSFPQTKEIRAARADLRAGRIDQSTYDQLMRNEIDNVIALQEDIGLDVLVHGEPERNDMVQYFAEQLDGYASTEFGWVQSYGTRCVRPPILHSDVSRPAPMTVDWTTYAQSRTSKPVKGMLTGPVTMLAWSFVRDDQPLSETARQVALALRDEIHDLESAGIRYIQLDEPALRERLPLRSAEQAEYLRWATEAFRLATSGVSESTQIHTHMCYSEFGEIVDAISELDADVTSVEAARSKMELVGDLRAAGYHRGIGPGIYDIHSPRVPSVEEMADALRRAVAAVPPDRLWVNPDCGLKTRTYDEVVPALRNLVEAARLVRAEL